MTHAEYRAAIKTLGLSQVGTASLFGVDPRTSRRWALGELPVPRAVELSLRLMLEHKITAQQAMALLDR